MEVEVAVLGSPSLISPVVFCGPKATLNQTPANDFSRVVKEIASEVGALVSRSFLLLLLFLFF